MFNRHDTFQHIVVWTIDILAIVVNLLFIAAITFRTPKQLRAYSKFLLNNAIIDLSSAVMSALGTVRVIQDHEGSMIFVFLGPCSLIREEFCHLCHALHINLVQQSTILLLLSFAFRLYIIGSNFPSRPAISSVRFALICATTLLPMTLPVLSWIVQSTKNCCVFLTQAANYLEQSSLPSELRYRFHLSGYVAAKFPIFGSNRAILMNGTILVLSHFVMTFIFIVRRKLIARIELAKTNDKRHHMSIAKALTYQMMLPCGVAVASFFWLCDLTQIWSSEFAERSLMILGISLSECIFSLASPLINFTVLPPYRALVPFFRPRKTTDSQHQNYNHTVTMK